MTEAMVSIVAALDLAQLLAAEAAIDALGNPATADIQAKLNDRKGGDAGVHFMSLHAFASTTAGLAHIVFEFSADGDENRAIGQIAAAIGPELASVFRFAKDWRDGSDMRSYLAAHKISIGFGLGANPGLAFAGTPGLSVGRILNEATLAATITTQLSTQPSGMSGLARLAAVRSALANDPAMADFLRPIDPEQSFAPASQGTVIFTLVCSFAKTYLWPFLLLLVAAAAWHGFHFAYLFDGPPHDPEHHHRAAELLRAHWWGLPILALLRFLFALSVGGVVLAMVIVGIGLVLYARLRKLERTDWVSTRAPDRATLHEILQRENIYAQNHMVSITQRKGGWLRYFTLRLVFWGIGNLSALLYQAGFLGPIGTIHFARWITIPGTRDLVFFSNFGGSWESYLEDFITLAANGLTGVWSNSVGFPLTTNLINDGATDGERFKRYARQSMIPTRFWYSAYPTLTTENIRRNAAIRRGLSGAMTEDDAAVWLGLFGSDYRPVEKLVTNEIQSLVFGGLGFLPFGTCTLWQLPEDVTQARAWLRAIKGEIAFNDGRRVRDNPHDSAAIQIAFSATGLARLGLPKNGLDTFPAAFLDDMAAPGRARIIGDTGSNAQDHWWWAKESPMHVAILIYGQHCQSDADTLEAKVMAAAAHHNVICAHRIPLKEVGKYPQPADPAQHDGEAHYFGPEAFGFADGVSQPVIKGTYKGQKNADPMHLVEPGEFVLGYPDGRQNLPPVPELNALDDPTNILPVLDGDPAFATNSVNNPRSIGFNGSYLVIRQLEQDVDAFNAYCATEAARLQKENRLLPPYVVTPEFVGAKMVGRWKNGSPLVRAPYTPSADGAIITENGFQLGSEDPEALRCPFGAHIRRTNPRDTLIPGSDAQISITNRHRILRVGRQYVPQSGQKPGLLFMCLNGDLERQFEFVQQTWALSSSFQALSGEQDPLLGSGELGKNGFTIPTRDGPVKLSPMAQFVQMRGGGYFFLAGKRLIDYLSA